MILLTYLFVLLAPALPVQDGSPSSGVIEPLGQVEEVLTKAVGMPEGAVRNDLLRYAIRNSLTVIAEGEAQAPQMERAHRLLEKASTTYVRDNLDEVTGLLKRHVQDDLLDFTHRTPEGRVVRFRIPDRIFFGGEIQNLKLAGDVRLGSLRPTRNLPGAVGVPVIVNIVDRSDSIAGQVNVHQKPGSEPVLRTIPVTVTFSASEAGAFEIAIHDPRRAAEVVVGGRTLPMKRDLAAPIASSVARIKYSGLGSTGMRNPRRVVERAGVYYLDPHHVGKDLIVFHHGLGQSPYVWGNLVSSILEDPVLSKRYSVAVGFYPTGLDPHRAAELLTNDLVRDQATLGFRKVTLIGHSLGGVVTRVMTSRPDLIERMPFVERAVFVAAPFEGSPLARFLRWPVLNTVAYRWYLGSARSFDALRPDGPFVQELRGLQPKVESHIIAGNRIRWFREPVYTIGQPAFASKKLRIGSSVVRIPLPSPLVPNDGLVALESALSLPSAASKTIYPASHGGLLKTDQTFRTLRDILITESGTVARPQTYRAEPKKPSQGAGFASFAAAYLLKAGINAAESGKASKFQQAAAEMGTFRFLADMAVFSGASRLTGRIVTGKSGPGFFLGALPVVVGTAAVQVTSGTFTWNGLAVSSGSYYVIGTAVNAAVDRALVPVLFGTAGPGRFWRGALTILKLTATLYFGEKFEHRIGTTLGIEPENPTGRLKPVLGLRPWMESLQRDRR